MWNNQGGGGGFQTYEQGGEQGQGFQSPGGFGTPQQSQNEKRSRQRAQNIIPVTVAEIINSTQTDDKFYSGDVEILQVTIVGLVRAVKETPTRLDYEIDDLTGPPLEVKQFVDNDESVPEDEKVQTMRENTYVRACGTVRSFGGKKSVVAFKVMPITDMNEVTYHMLEVIHSHASLAAAPSNSMDTGAPVNGMSHNPNNYGDNGGDGTVSGLSSIQNQVHIAIRNNPTPEGASVESVCRASVESVCRVHIAIRNNPTPEGASVESVCKQIRGVPEKAIRDAIEFLSSEGHIYSTIDDEHYKATDS